MRRPVDDMSRAVLAVMSKPACAAFTEMEWMEL
jgi:hypothetical protein